MAQAHHIRKSTKLRSGCHSPVASPSQPHPKLPWRLSDIKVWLLIDLADNDLTNTFVIMYNTPGVVNTTAFELDHYINTLAWIVSYRVITRTSNYPYHFNLMNNLQVVSSTRNFATTTTYNVLKSYSSMSSGNTYTTFAQVNGSYSNMKIITYLSCFAFNGTGANPIVFIDTAIINATHMNFVLTFGATASLGRCHLNMIVYNQAQL